MKKRAIVFGVGNGYLHQKEYIYKYYDVVGLVDNNYSNIPCCDNPIERISVLDWDIIIVTPYDCYDIYQQLIGYGIERKKIVAINCRGEAFGEDTFGYKIYGQHGEDLIIAYIFKRIGIEKPNYVDLGANHPFIHNNTANLYKNGCRGINIEPNPGLIRLFEIARSEDVNLSIGVAPEEGTLLYYELENPGLNTFSEEMMKKRVKQGEKLNRISKIKTLKLETIIDTYCNGQYPDYLDCDIEGMDYEVLIGCEFGNSGPKVICVERDAQRRNVFNAMMFQKGYRLFCEMSVNGIYIRDDIKL